MQVGQARLQRFASFPTRYICLIRSCSCANSSFGLKHAPAFAGNMYLITETTLNIFSIWVVILQLLPCQSFLLYFLCIRMAYISFYNQPHPYTGIAYIPRFILLTIYAENPATMLHWLPCLIRYPVFFCYEIHIASECGCMSELEERVCTGA